MVDEQDGGEAVPEPLPVLGRPGVPADLPEDALARHGLGPTVRVMTLEEARALLGPARRIIAVMQALQDEMTSLLLEVQQRLAAGADEDDEGLQEVHTQADEVHGEWDSQARALRDLGCSLKGLEPALLDWYGVVDGHLVEWCWFEGEATIEHWHPIGVGFAGRRLLLEA